MKTLVKLLLACCFGSAMAQSSLPACQGEVRTWTNCFGTDGGYVGEFKDGRRFTGIKPDSKMQGQSASDTENERIRAVAEQAKRKQAELKAQTSRRQQQAKDAEEAKRKQVELEAQLTAVQEQAKLEAQLAETQQTTKPTVVGTTMAGSHLSSSSACITSL